MKTLRIGSRRSDLARIQAYTVANQLLKLKPDLKIEFVMKASFGDENPNISLKESPERGLFTKDLSHDLKTGVVDVVVHSWKDLPVDLEPGSEIVATLQRADPRDLILIKKESVSRIQQSQEIVLLSSSPRRAHNLKSFIPKAVPLKIERVLFKEIRGNIPTRFQKLLGDKDADALVVAKAALDRMLSAEHDLKQENFRSVSQELRAVLDQCRLMVLPLSVSPPAPAQGALAIEARSDDVLIKNLFQNMHCTNTFEDVQWERQSLKAFGGGCHLKLGIFKRSTSQGTWTCSKGKTPSGEELCEDSWDVPSRPIGMNCVQSDLWPEPESSENYFDREKLELKLNTPAQTIHWVAKAEALPSDLTPEFFEDSVIACPGLSTWYKLADRGFWIGACSDHWGESLEVKSWTPLWGNFSKAYKWTHSEAKKIVSHDSSFADFQILESYRLKRNHRKFSLKGKKVFFWKSASLFKAALKECPEIVEKVHFCGLGHTYDYICQKVASERVIPVRTYKDFLNFCLKKN